MTHNNEVVSSLIHPSRWNRARFGGYIDTWHEIMRKDCIVIEPRDSLTDISHLLEYPKMLMLLVGGQTMEDCVKIYLASVARGIQNGIIKIPQVLVSIPATWSLDVGIGHPDSRVSVNRIISELNSDYGVHFESTYYY